MGEKKGRVIVVSNRLPLKVKKENGKYTYTPSSGGLVTGLQCARGTLNFLWMGTLDNIPEKDQEEVRNTCITEYEFYPIFVDENMYDKYYNNMCNGVLWPILHSFPDFVSLNTEDYLAYKEVNRIFVEELLKLLQEKDALWVHDYHLMLLPEMIRKASPFPMKIGFFLHIPFPNYFSIKGFPLLQSLIDGLLGADLIAFHTFDYLGNFLDSCRIYATEVSSSFTIKHDGRIVKVEAIPIGIDPAIFMKESLKDQTKHRVSLLKEKFKGKKIILGIDRVDYIKGIPHRIEAFSKLLKRRPDLQDKVVFLQVGVPSRMEVRVYKILSDALCKLSGLINSNGVIEETNLFFINNSVSFSELCALYCASDLCVISSLRDGMNLVSLEFIACPGPGALVMSNHAGATGLLIGAIVANPWDISELSQAYERALELPEQESIERKISMQKAIGKFTAMDWGKKFVAALKDSETDISNE
ncbi:trehalose 6-phosphate synthase [Nematocida sp. LUAm3]|nr:trehalose 6-phosphate synthase [Nematocida sp. LUAm3]KAI5174944.1 trehalose 6-phosphate synthase [Nematocida sp. LUAm2]KAI5177457.1 trehalose 6-phosphate synthase [Nematocida sp. LUAm1]